MTEVDFMRLTRDFWEKPYLEINADLVSEVSDWDEDEAIEYLELIQAETGVLPKVDLDRHGPRIWSMASVLKGLAPSIARRAYEQRYVRLPLIEIFRQVQS
ncbi:MAG: hypothetical protein ACFB11_23565 [Paracoccaceae bacterium]